ncbi:MAG: GAF domain-containing protein [Bacteroidota bacterium]
MENSPTLETPPTLLPAYVSLKELRKHIRKQNWSPYPSQFSLAKLIRKLKAQSDSIQNDILAASIIHLEDLEQKIKAAAVDWEALSQQPDFATLMQHIFPSFFFEGQLGIISGPFENKEFRFHTQAFLELEANDQWEVKVMPNRLINNEFQHIHMAGSLVLNAFYQQEVDMYAIEGLVLRHKETKLEKHLRFDVIFDYLEVKPLKPLKKLSPKKIYHLLNNLEDRELWLECIPPENFLFEGFIIGRLVESTKPEILSTLKELAANNIGSTGQDDDLDYLEELTKSYLGMPDLEIGVLQTIERPWIESLTWCLLRTHDDAMINPSLKDIKSGYGQVMHSKKPFIVEDLKSWKSLSALEAAILEKGLRSLLLAPLFNASGQVIGIFEIGVPKPYQFTQLTLQQLQELIALMEIGTNKFINEMENAVRLTIQQEYTSIHSSVEWKFRKVASEYFWYGVIEKQQVNLEPITFKNIYPIYGQADIVSSSKLRNHSIQADLVDNLERVYEVLVESRKAVHFHLLDIYSDKVAGIIQKLTQNGIVSSDESVVVELLTTKIHPLLRELKERFASLPQELIADYFAYLDPELDIVYRSRKAYEDSVTSLNQAISDHLLEEERKMQDILPHYFEKFQTDGVEYNIYIGQSLLEKETFHEFYLHDFRLWQLIMMCEITRLVEVHAKTLPVPLTTAQLIFVFNSSLSIRFEMDEKQFDVDGAYNVRYEILKKRIDKAYIKGTDERLTQAGKVAIVWLQEKDRQEYQAYLDHLVQQGYISPDIEDLELERMQGVEGLRAMRVTVV